VVEVVRGSKPVVPPDWRSLTVTGRARSAIRRHIRQTEKEEFLRLGRASVEQVFERAGKKLKDVSLRPILERFALETEEGCSTPSVAAGSRPARCWRPPSRA
jgi:guanosine-3',5'-bis(diphosphate) 3'-pyrophosphohydrolase